MTIEIITPSAKLEWSHLIEKVPEDSEYNPGKYDTQIWLPKTDKEFKKKLENLMQEAITEKWGASPPPKVTLAKILDGDVQSYTNGDGEEIFPNKGMYGFRCGTKRRPVVVDETGSPLTDESALGYTLRGNVKIHAYGWEHGKSRKGVSIGLDAVMLTDLGVSTSSGGIEGFEFQEAASA